MCSDLIKAQEQEGADNMASIKETEFISPKFESREVDEMARNFLLGIKENEEVLESTNNPPCITSEDIEMVDTNQNDEIFEILLNAACTGMGIPRHIIDAVEPPFAQCENETRDCFNKTLTNLTRRIFHPHRKHRVTRSGFRHEKDIMRKYATSVYRRNVKRWMDPQTAVKKFIDKHAIHFEFTSKIQSLQEPAVKDNIN